MITIFNRRELYVTFSMKRQAEVRDILSGHGIAYQVKTVNRNSPSPIASGRSRVGTAFENPDRAYEYIIYVRRKDYKTAKNLI